MPTFTYLSLALVLAVTGLILTDNFALQTVFLLRLLLWAALLKSECWQTYSFLNVALMHEGNVLRTVRAEFDFNWKSWSQSCYSFSSFTGALITIFQSLDSTICPPISSDIAFHFIISLQVFIVPHCKYL